MAILTCFREVKVEATEDQCLSTWLLRRDLRLIRKVLFLPCGSGCDVGCDGL